MQGGQVHHAYNFGGLQHTVVSSPQALAPGRHTVHYEFVYDGGRPGSGGISRLRVDGVQVGEARVPQAAAVGGLLSLFTKLTKTSKVRSAIKAVAVAVITELTNLFFVAAAEPIPE